MRSIALLTIIITSIPFIGSQSIDPSNIDQPTKEKWCLDQKSSCPLLCLQIPGASSKPSSNTCDASSLSYSCVCSNGQQPNAANYSQTIPYYECTQAATDCVNNCASGDSACQSSCRTAHPCGAQNPTRINTTSSSSTMSATASDGAAATGGSSATSINVNGFGSQSTGSSKSAASTVQAWTLGFGGTYALATLLGCILGGFMMML